MKLTDKQAYKFQESLYPLKYWQIEALLKKETNAEKIEIIERTLKARRICGEPNG